MLDFYLLADIQPVPNQVSKLEYIDELEEDVFFQLQEEGVIEPWFDYYGSFRWESEIVARILLKLQQQPVVRQGKNRAFITLLQKAHEANSGMLAVGN